MPTMHYKKSILLSLLLITLFSVLASQSQAQDLRLDHRRYTDRSGARYYVVLAARGGSATGHAFVVWGMEDPKRQLSSQVAYGFYPAQGSKYGVFGSVPGEVRNEALMPNTSLITVSVGAQRIPVVSA